jgi:hypothetical protein
MMFRTASGVPAEEANTKSSSPLNGEASLCSASTADKLRGIGNVPLRRLRLRLDEAAPTVKLTTNTDHTLAGVHVLPAQPERLPLPNAGQHRDGDERPEAIRRRRDQPSDRLTVERRELPPLHLRPLAPLQLRHRIRRDQPTPLRRAEQTAEHNEHAALSPRREPLPPQVGEQGRHVFDVNAREPPAAEPRQNVEAEVGRVTVDRLRPQPALLLR